MNFNKTSLFAVFALAVGLTAWTGCKDDKTPATTGDDDEAGAPPSCQAILDVCHHVDPGTGPIHDCHETAHDDPTEEKCAAVKDNCVAICEAAETDAGEDHDGH